MRAIQQSLMSLAAIGLAASFILHCMAWFGFVPGGVWWLWTLDIGIFVVIVPCMILLGFGKRNDMKVVLSGCPSWMKWSFYALVVYAISHYFLSALNHPGVRSRKMDGSPFGVRLASGHWMIFYAGAVCVLYSAIHAPHLLIRRKCPLGHKAEIGAKSCEECGYVFSNGN